jgi:hypothetical protein
MIPPYPYGEENADRNRKGIQEYRGHEGWEEEAAWQLSSRLQGDHQEMIHAEQPYTTQV